MLESLNRLRYSLAHWIYSLTFQRNCGCVLICVGYIALLMWFAHLETIYVMMSDSFDKTNTHPLIVQHARFLTFLTNWGLLLLLFIDLYLAGKIDNPKVVTAINVFGVLAIIITFGCAAGCVLDAETVKTLGVFANAQISMISLSFFALILCYLKYLSIKPQK